MSLGARDMGMSSEGGGVPPSSSSRRELQSYLGGSELLVVETWAEWRVCVQARVGGSASHPGDGERERAGESWPAAGVPEPAAEVPAVLSAGALGGSAVGAESPVLLPVLAG